MGHPGLGLGLLRGDQALSPSSVNDILTASATACAGDGAACAPRLALGLLRSGESG